MDPHGKTTWPGLPHTGVSHDHVNLARSKPDLHSRPSVIAHGRVPAKPKFSPIQKRPILRALRHSKAYLNTWGGT
ncbi:hypothetical protein F383_28405 [Gossypium arboreum]|uniref:Uncharacterized protein n=1 Tax=Gossypium arboreum TaxID=29729 RepID=A0A0B0P8P8_GOSAR|nr:hypothetical protein F383_28405 [Gossypium arboreum]